MNFNVYLDDDLVRRLAAVARRTGSRRNAIIRQAVAAWVGQAGAQWPKAVLDWTGEVDATPFEEMRTELAEPSGDPFAPAPSSRTRTSPRRTRVPKRR